MHVIMRIKNLADTLCVLVYYSIIVHVTVRVENLAETLFTSLGASVYCSPYCRHNFDRKNCWCTIHVTLDAILTAKTIDALFMS